MNISFHLLKPVVSLLVPPNVSFERGFLLLLTLSTSNAFLVSGCIDYGIYYHHRGDYK